MFFGAAYTSLSERVWNSIIKNRRNRVLIKERLHYFIGGHKHLDAHSSRYAGVWVTLHFYLACYLTSLRYQPCQGPPHMQASVKTTPDMVACEKSAPDRFSYCTYKVVWRWRSVRQFHWHWTCSLVSPHASLKKRESSQTHNIIN